MAKVGRYQIWVDGCPTNNTNNDLTKVIDLAHRLHLITKRQYQVRGPGGVVVWTSEGKGGAVMKRALKAILEGARNLRTKWRQSTSRRTRNTWTSSIRPRRCRVMNRDILFRGKRLDNGEWVFGDLMTKYPHHEGLTIVEHGCVYHEVDPKTVGQYLALFDDNGDEIYQGDIVKVHHKGETYTPYVSEVYFEPHCGAMVKSHPSHIEMGHDQFRHLSGYCDYGVGGNPEVCCEIIGNIHDNPELLEVE